MLILRAFQQMEWQDAVDILVVAFVVYRIFLAIQGTRAVQMIIGLIILMMASFVSQWAQLHTINWVLDSFLTIWVLAVVVLFQPELRRTLAEVGRHKFLRAFHKLEKAALIEEILRATVNMAGRKIGALLVFERETKLQNFIEAGTVLDAEVSRGLLLSIFNSKSPLHDGAVIVREGRIAAAGCFLPLTLKQNISKEMGTRHRAALGLTEETDATVIVVSEETGNISLVQEGQLTQELDAISLRRHLQEAYEPKEPAKRAGWMRWRGRARASAQH